jgi:CubicO group peptidase (beta-lactamase class C family)
MRRLTTNQTTHEPAPRRTFGRLALAIGVGAALVPGVIGPRLDAAAQTPLAAGTVSEEVRTVLEGIRTKYNMPSLAGGYTVGGQVFEYAATGWRQWGTDNKVTDNDVYHLGSVTKSLTGTVIAKLVEQGVLGWDQNLDQLLPGFPMRAEYKGVTLSMLMGHRSGLTGATYPAGITGILMNGQPINGDQRRAYIQFMLNTAPTSAPGTRYEYSNPGTATAAFVAEQKTGKSIEQLAWDLVWQPLGMSSCSMGTVWPNPSAQPNPHRWTGTTPTPAPAGAGNARVIDGADQSRCSVRDVLAYARAHAMGESVGGLLQPAAWKELHTVKFPDNQGYAAGWIAGPVPSSIGGTGFGHAGSNTLNYATVTFAPSTQVSVVVATNIGITIGENNLGRTSVAEREAFFALSELAAKRVAQQKAAATPATTAAPTAEATTVPAAAATTKAAAKKKVCTVNKTTKKRTCR